MLCAFICEHDECIYISLAFCFCTKKAWMRVCLYHIQPKVNLIRRKKLLLLFIYTINTYLIIVLWFFSHLLRWVIHLLVRIVNLLHFTALLVEWYIPTASRRVCIKIFFSEFGLSKIWFQIFIIYRWHSRFARRSFDTSMGAFQRRTCVTKTSKLHGTPTIATSVLSTPSF